MELPTPDSQALQHGTQLEEFVIEKVLGSGGFGITYLARDTSLGRQVVIKENLPTQFAWRETTTGTVRPRHTTGGDVDDYEWSMKNFLREAETLASLDHPGIVRVLRKFETNGTAYFVMPFVQGLPFDSLMEDRKSKGSPFSEEELGGLLDRMLAALGYLHQHGIYHRDIKPANILITQDGIPVLIDFGSARQQISERSMTVIESAGYTPFEQLQSRGNVGPWSDLYALAGTLVKGITFETPPKANDRAFDDPWVPLAQRESLRAIYSAGFLASIDRAMAVRIENRWKDAGDWLAALRGNATVDEPQAKAMPPSHAATARPPTTLPPSGKARSHASTPPTIYALLGKKITPARWVIAACAVLVLGAWAMIPSSNPKTDAATAVVSNSSTDDNATQAHPVEHVQKNADVKKSEEPIKQQSASVGTVGGVRLKTTLPPELIEGKPRPMNVPNLVLAPTTLPEFFVPAGTVLLSKGKKVTSSDNNPIIGTLDLITDGEKDAGEGYFVEILDGKQWVQIDLENSAAIYAIWMWHFHSQKRAYNAVIVQISDDPKFSTGVTTVFNNDYNDSSNMGRGGDAPYVESRFGKIIDGKGTKGRYVRLYSNGSTSNEYNHYIEVEVYGKSLPSERVKVESAAAPAMEQVKHLDAKLRSDSSYALGFRTGSTFSEDFGKFGITADDIEQSNFIRGFMAAVKGGKAELSEEKLQAAMQKLGDILQAREKKPTGSKIDDISPIVKSDSSYALGFRTGSTFSQKWGRFGMIVEDIEQEDFLKGFMAAVKGGKDCKPELGEARLQAAMQALGDVLQVREKEIAVVNLEACKKFLEVNGRRPQVITTQSGLQYEVIAKGGGEKYVAPKTGTKANKEFMIHYKGTLINGYQFDASPEGDPVAMTLEVVDGFKEALTTMPVGAKWKLFLPASLAYGEQRRSSDIGPNCALIFELELVKIQDAKEGEKK